MRSAGKGEDDEWDGDVEISKDRPESILNTRNGNGHTLACESHATSHTHAPYVEPSRELLEFSRFLAENVFCSTGEGGGIDPSCSEGGGSKYVGEKVGKAEHDHASGVEKSIATAIKGEWGEDNEPYDVLKGKNAVEVKSMLKGSKTAISVHPDALVRKVEWEKESGGTFHTVVVDERETYQGGAHKDKFSGNRLYYKRGSGRYSLSQMHPVSDKAELEKLIKTPADKLPERATGELPRGKALKVLKEQAEKTHNYRIEQNRKRRAEGKI